MYRQSVLRLERSSLELLPLPARACRTEQSPQKFLTTLLQLLGRLQLGQQCHSSMEQQQVLAQEPAQAQPALLLAPPQHSKRELVLVPEQALDSKLALVRELALEQGSRPARALERGSKLVPVPAQQACSSTPSFGI